MAAFIGKIKNYLDKKVALFFLLRIIGILFGLILISYQYHLESDLKQYFHHFPFLMFLVYLVDAGYSEIVTQKLEQIDYFFIKKLLWIFPAAVLISVITFKLNLFSSLYIQWLILSIVYIPFQAYFDIIYRIILKSSQALYFVIYQTASPVLILLMLMGINSLVPSGYIFIYFVSISLLIQIIYLSGMYLLNKKIFIINKKNTSEHNPVIYSKAFAYKLFPLFAYEIFSISYTTCSDNAGFGLELIRSAYFIVGFILLLIYTKSNNLYKFLSSGIQNIALLLILFTLFVRLSIGIAKKVFFLTPLVFSWVDMVLFVAIITVFSVYINKYSRWIFTKSV